MGKLTLPFAFLWCDLCTADETPAHLPFCFPDVRTFFGHADDSTSYPINGFLALPRDCDDFKGFVKTDSDWLALQDFFNHAKSLAPDHRKEFEAIATLNNKNKYLVGARVFKLYFENVWQRAPRKKEIDDFLRSQGALPFQVFDKYGKKWPNPTRVCSHLLL